MMFDIGWSELLVIGVVALVVIGPKDLPKALRTVGIWMRKARQISGEFRASLDQMVREAELEEVREQVRKAAELDLDKEFARTVDPTGSLAESLRPPELDLEPPAKPAAALEPPSPQAPLSAPAGETAPVAAAETPHAGEPPPGKAASG
jgi:sec-independent protein translocase protein TatB